LLLQCLKISTQGSDMYKIWYEIFADMLNILQVIVKQANNIKTTVNKYRCCQQWPSVLGWRL